MTAKRLPRNRQFSKFLPGFSFSRVAFRLCVASLAIVLSISFSLSCFAQRQPERPAALDPVQGKSEARTLIAEMLSQKGAGTNTGWLKIRDANREEKQIPMRFKIWSTATNSTSMYEAMDAGPPRGDSKLTVMRADGQTNQYFLSENDQPPRALAGNETMVPFAGSDFFVADLGLEFLHWPQQRLTKKEMKRSRFCGVLESINPNPAPNGYSRVVCWVEHEAPYGIVHADAYDAKGKIFKRFDPTEFEKVQGQYQLQEMEIRNVKAGTSTRIEFNLEK